MGSSPLTRGKLHIVRMVTGQRGSSPLTRGKPPAVGLRALAQRLIPAHAGKTAESPVVLEELGAHPRSRGENFWLHWRHVTRAGSSPLTRGKRARGRAARLPSGLIPAHAGKTRRRGQRQTQTAAHPRSRGENHRTRRPQAPRLGSSPLTRGKRGRFPLRAGRRGLIPAHAGKTRSRGCSRRWCGAHPRSRGENHARALQVGAGGGSSPLTRGKPTPRPSTARPSGLIPAHAGKTRRPRDRVTRYAAHPRSRGENDEDGGAGALDDGSSPLTRGKLGCPFLWLLVAGLIPAHAGKTRRPGRSA